MVPQKKEDFVQCNLLVKSKVTRGFQLPAICELLFVSHIKVVSFWDPFKFHPKNWLCQIFSIYDHWGLTDKRNQGHWKWLDNILHSNSNQDWGFWTYLGQTFILSTLVVFFVDFDFSFNNLFVTSKIEFSNPPILQFSNLKCCKMPLKQKKNKA